MTERRDSSIRLFRQRPRVGRRGFRCVYHTSDGGTTWTEQATPPHPNPLIEAYQVLFLDDKKGFVVTDDGYLEATEDGERPDHRHGPGRRVLPWPADKQNGGLSGRRRLLPDRRRRPFLGVAEPGLEAALPACSFADVFHGVRGGDPGTVFRTDDGEHRRGRRPGRAQPCAACSSPTPTGWVVATRADSAHDGDIPGRPDERD
jgi:hypothetical protein